MDLHSGNHRHSGGGDMYHLRVAQADPDAVDCLVRFASLSAVAASGVRVGAFWTRLKCLLV